MVVGSLHRRRDPADDHVVNRLAVKDPDDRLGV